MLVALALARQPAAQDIDYKSLDLDCQWLEAEYERIFNDNLLPPREIPAKLKVARAVAAPIAFVADLMGSVFEPPEATPLGGSVDFSGDVDDVEDASRYKNCYHLTERILNDREAGKHEGFTPRPVKSAIAQE